MKRTLSVPTFLLVALFGLSSTSAVQAQTPPTPAPKAFNAVGDYEYSTTVDGQQSVGVISIFKQDDVLKGKIMTDMMGEIPITAVKVEGKVMTLTAVLPDGELSIALTFGDDHNKFDGNWSMGGAAGGAIAGKRKTS
jgi:hypothetical protein